jgi:hypothetical protein
LALLFAFQLKRNAEATEMITAVLLMKMRRLVERLAEIERFREGYFNLEETFNFKNLRTRSHDVYGIKTHLRQELEHVMN